MRRLEIETIKALMRSAISTVQHYKRIRKEIIKSDPDFPKSTFARLSQGVSDKNVYRLEGRIQAYQEILRSVKKSP